MNKDQHNWKPDNILNKNVLCARCKIPCRMGQLNAMKCQKCGRVQCIICVGDNQTACPIRPTG